MVGPFLRSARAAGVTRVVMLSSSAVRAGDPGLGEIDTLVRDTFPEWVVLRPSWFMQNFVGDHPLARSIRESGTIVTAAGDGRLPFVDAEDIGATAAALLAGDSLTNAELLVTGPEPLSYDDAAAAISEAFGTPVHHHAVSTEERTRQYVDAGYAAGFAAMLSGLDALVRRGDQDTVVDTVQRVTGRPPRSLRDFLSLYR